MTGIGDTVGVTAVGDTGGGRGVLRGGDSGVTAG